MGIAEFANTLLHENPYFTAGFGLVGLGAGMAVLKQLGSLATIFARRNYTMTLEVPSYDKSYQWLLQWITAQGQRRAQHLSVETSFHQSEAGKVQTQYNFIPSTGVHFFFYGGHWIRVERTREKQMLGAPGLSQPFESVTLTTIGRKRQLFFNVLNEARRIALAREDGWTMIYKAFGAEWRQFGYPRRRRPIDSVILGAGLSDRILDDVREFIDNQHWYTERGIPYRRGYLLYGPPGCGKSSFINALAGELEYSICVLSLSEMGMTADRLDHLLTHAPLQSLILLEDIDAAFTSRELTQTENIRYQGLPRLTLSGLLNALDGVASTEGRILFMTTNYPERLDPALIRPGRVDLQVEISYCSDIQLIRMFERFYPGVDGELARRFAQEIGDTKISAAHVQGYFLCHKDNPESALEDLQEFLTALKTARESMGHNV